MKKPWLAFLLNFLIAGLGIIYLGLWNWGFFDFSATIALGILLKHFAPHSLGMAAIVLPVVNGTIAMNLARSRNAKGALAAQAEAPLG